MLLMMVDEDADYVTQVLPGVSLFWLGPALTAASEDLAHGEPQPVVA